MNGFEFCKMLQGQVSNIGLLDSDELGEKLDCFNSSLPGYVVLVDDCQIDGFKQDRVITVILVHVLRHLHILVDPLDLSVHGA